MGKLRGDRKQKQLFKTRIVPAKAGSGTLFEEKFVANDGPGLGFLVRSSCLRRNNGKHREV